MISIIIPVYNAASYLDKCIESILHQKYKDFELLLINDGSTDNSGDICDAFALKDNRISVFHQQNQGVSAARNLGIEQAKGEWLQFIDSDDWIENDFLLNNVSRISQKKDFVVSGYKIDECIKQYEFHLEECSFEEDKFLGGIKYIYKRDCLGMNWNKLFHRETIISNNIRFNPNLNYGEDELFVLEYLKYVNKIVTSSCCGYHYVQYNNTTSSLSKRAIQIKERINIANLFYKAGATIREEDKYALFFKQVYARYIYFTFLQHYSFNKTEMSVEEKKQYLPLLYELMYATNFCHDLIPFRRQMVLKIIFFIKNAKWIDFMFTLDAQRIKIQKRIFHK